MKGGGQEKNEDNKLQASSILPQFSGIFDFKILYSLLTF